MINKVAEEQVFVLPRLNALALGCEFAYGAYNLYYLYGVVASHALPYSFQCEAV